MTTRELVWVLGAVFVCACGDDDGAMDGGADVGMVDASTDSSPDAVVDAEADAEADTGPAGYDEPTSTSGTRLRRIYFDSDGAHMTIGLWDSELETQCTFSEAPDGSQRCRPRLTGDVYFSDSACTQAMVRTESECTTNFAERRTTNAIYRRTDTPVVLTDGVYFEVGPGDCRMTGIAPIAYSVAEEMPSSQFVRGTIDDQALAGDLVARYIDGEDGSRVLHAVLHQLRGYQCDFDADPEHVCLTFAPGFGRTFLDAACTQALVGVGGSSGEGPSLTARYSGCDVPEYHEVGSEVSPVVVYSNRTGACVAEPPAIGLTYYRVGAEVSLDSLPAATRTLEGEGVLQAMRRVDSEGAPLGAPYGFWNPATDRACRPAVFPDGSHRCLPVDSLALSRFWSDAACAATPLASVPSCAVPGDLLFEYQSSCTPGALGVGTLYEGGDVLASTTVYDGPPDCRARTISDDERMGYLEGGAEVSATTLPELQLVID